MTIRSTFILGLILLLASLIVACGGSGITGDGDVADAIGTDNDVVDNTDDADDPGGSDTLADAEPDPDPVDGTTVDDGQGGTVGGTFEECLRDKSDDCAAGVTTCMESEMCAAAIECMAGCGDTTCALGCLEGTSADDTAVLEGLLTCAAFGGCFDLPDPPDPVCGDGTCDEGEDAEACPDDCGAADISCIADNCTLGNCMDMADCAAVIECMAGCDDTECATECIALAPPEAEAMLTDIANCADEAECFVAAPTGPVCGDAVCDEDETCESCAEDCGDCASDCCGAHEGGGCDDSTCEGFICEMDMTCCTDTWHEDCVATAMAICDVCQAVGPSCGNGLCEDGEDEVSCAKDCAVVPPESCVADNCGVGGCMEVELCAAAIACMDACDDAVCAAACLDASPAAVEDLPEDIVTCGVDAGCYAAPPEPPSLCLADNCDTGNCEQFPECQAALDCMALCESTQCATDCVLDTTAAFQAPLFNLLQCGVDNGCLTDPSQICGDGGCTGNEDADSCPEDCPTVCGDGACTGSESAQNCVTDCPAECGDGVCTVGETEAACPEDCQGVMQYYGVLIQDNWNGECLNYNAAGADISAVELLSCPSDNPDDCVSLAFFAGAFADVGTDGCQNDFTNPQEAEGECGCDLDDWLTLQGGWVAGAFGDTPITSGLVVRVYEYGSNFGGEPDPYTVSLVTDQGCMDSGSFDGCTLDLGPGVDISEHLVP